MWKETIICVVIVIAIVIGNYITQNYTVQSVEELTSKLGELKQEIVKEEGDIDREKANNKMEEIKKSWEARHDKLEKVETDLTSLKSFIETNSYSEATSELDKSVFVLQHIEDKYAFNLENVF